MSVNITEKEGNKDSSFLNVNLMKVKNEMIYLKNDILKDIKTSERNFLEKLKSSNKLVDEKLEEFEKKLESYNQKLFTMSQLVAEGNYLKEGMEKLSKEKIEMKDQLLSIGIKQDKLENQLKEKIDYIETILNNSVKYTGIIGNNNRFANFHEFIDYTLSQISLLTMATKKHTTDMKSYKNKFDSNLQNFGIKIDEMIKSSNQKNKILIKESENNTNNNINLLESKFRKYNEENNDQINTKINQLNNNIRNDFKNEIESNKKKFEEDNNKVNKAISDIDEQINELKKLNEEIKIINMKINEYEEIMKKEKENKIIESIKKEKNQIDENEIVNKYLKREINENQFLIYKEFMKINFMIKNIINNILEKSHNAFNKAVDKLNLKKSDEENLIKYLSPYFNNIISEISNRRTKGRTVNNLLNCINIKLTYKKRDKKEPNNKSLKIRKNNSSENYRTFDFDNEFKLSDNNYFGYNTLQMSDRGLNYKIFNSDNFNNNEGFENIDKNIFRKKEVMKNKNYSNERKIKYQKDNIIIDCEKNKNEENKVKEFKNKKIQIIREKLAFNETNKSMKDLINSTFKNKARIEKISRRKIKDNLLRKIQNSGIKREESKQLNRTMSPKNEMENKIEKNSTSMISTYKPFKGKKYIAYEKSLDAKIKEKLIYSDIDYKEKMKRNKNTGFSNDFSSLSNNNNTFMQKTRKNIEADNFKKMVNNLNSFINNNSDKPKYFFTRNKINNMNRIKENLLNDN